jgi:hypothetical protein
MHRAPCPSRLDPFTKWRAAVAILPALAGCATTTMAVAEKDAAAKSFATTGEHANVYLYRLSVTAGAQKYLVSLDGRVLGESAVGTFLHAAVAPGEHTLVLTGKSQASLSFSAEAGTNVFIKVDPLGSGWWWPAPTTVQLLQVRAAPTSEVLEVRSRVVAGLNRGELTGPDGEMHRWRVPREGVSCPLEGEEAIVNGLARW